MTDDLDVFPAPRHVGLDGRGGSLEPVGHVRDQELPPHGYRLRIGTDGTTVEHADEHGRRYGTETLGQLRRRGRPIGTGIVEDHPTFVERGFMLDVSRDRVPTVETLEWLVDVLGRLRFTELQLYTEHTFAWRGHEAVWGEADPLTPGDLATVAERARAAGIRLVPCCNTFGHMERWLRVDQHRHRAECPDGAPALVGDGTVPPTTLAPTDDNAAFVVGLVRELLEAVPSTRVNIGGDEPFELGLGRTAAEVEQRGRTAVYVEHLARILGPLVADGLEVLFWGDVLAHEPARARELPPGAVAVAWWYEPPVADPPPMSRLLGGDVVRRIGMPEDALAGFAAHTRAYLETGFPFWVAPGTSSWNSLVGRWPAARQNIDDAVAMGAERGARGVLLTDWGDNGHHQPLACSLPAIVHGAGAAWCAASHQPSAVPTVIDDLLGARGPGALLVDLGSVESTIGVRQFNGGAMHGALLGGLQPPGRHRFDADAAAAAAATLDRAAGFTPAAADPRIEAIAAEIRAAAGLALLGLHRLGRALDVPVPVASPDRAAAVAAQRAAWLRTSRPGGLADSLARIAP